jgi:Fe-S oxidoreductase
VKASNPEFAQWTAAERLTEAASTGAEALVTACPHCVQNLEEKGSDRKVYDIVEILDKAI